MFGTGKLKLKRGDRSLLVHHYVDSHGRKRFVGNKKEMKRSGTFVCILNIFLFSNINPESSMIDSSFQRSPKRCWIMWVNMSKYM